MDNLFVNCFFGNDTTSIRKIFSSEETISEEEKNTGDFFNILGIRIGNSLFGQNAHTPEEVGHQTVVKDTDENALSANTGEELIVGYPDTQSIIALLQTYLNAQKLQNMKDGAINDARPVNLEEFLRGLLNLLQEGESVQFTGNRSVGKAISVSELENKRKTIESDHTTVVDSRGTPNNTISIGYLASILQQLNASENISKQKETTEIDQTSTVDSRGTPNNTISIGYLASVLQQLNASENISKQKETTEIDQTSTVDSRGTPNNTISIGYLASVLRKFNTSENIGKQKETIESDRNPAADSKRTPDNTIPIYYLASVLQQLGVSEINVNRAEKAHGYNEDTTKDELKTTQDKDIFQILEGADKNQESIKTAGMRKDRSMTNETEISTDLENNDGDIFNSADVTVKPVYKIEVKKLNEKENTFQIFTNESSFDGNEDTNKNVSPFSMKAERTVSFSDDNALSVVKEVSDKGIDDYSGSDGRQLLSRHDFTMSHARLSQEQGKVSEHVPFTSIMTDRIEKIVEHYANKGVSADLVVRLKIDEKETLIVGLKDQGQTVAVEIKTTDESMGNFLSSQKGEITKQLEEKNIFANIYVDMENDNPEKRKQGEHNKQKNANPEKVTKDNFNTFMETMV